MISIPNIYNKTEVRPVYDDIFTMPVYNWFKVMSEQNFGFLFQDSTFKNAKNVELESSESLLDVWHSLNNQFYDEFGQDETTINILEKKRDIGLLKAEFIITGDKFKLTEIEIKEMDLEKYESKEAFDYNKEIGIVSKYMGEMIDIKKTSVHQYHTAKNLLKNGN